MRFRPADEWLEPDGLGGFASGTVAGPRTRRYHALLLPATRAPAGRVVAVSGVDAQVETGGKTFAISAQRYQPGVTHPDGDKRVRGFWIDPWPRWRFALENLGIIEQQLFAVHGAPLTVMTWRMIDPTPPGAVLVVRPFLAARDYHALSHENGGFRMEPEQRGRRQVWQPYPGMSPIVALSDGEWRQEPYWYRGFSYDEDRERGLDHVEDLASPGSWRFDLGRGATLILASDDEALSGDEAADEIVGHLAAREQTRRAQLRTPLERAADAYVVRRGEGRTIIAGYPWFCDWGRDTFIALRGLCLGTGRLDDARKILVEWSQVVSEGMLPNRFTDTGEAPEYNSVDGSLWYVVAAHAYFQAAARVRHDVPAADRAAIESAIIAIVDGYARGTRMGIRADYDGLLAAGAPGWQLTWMDARVDGQEITPRIGKPIEVQALWLNALRIAADLRLPSSERWETLFARAVKIFPQRFWYVAGGYLHDVVDDGHVSGACDSRLRPNQLLAIGGLPLALLDGDRAARVVALCEEQLWTPLGLRSLAPGERGYAPRYTGGVAERDRAYHNGTVWPWLLGPFVEAWVRVRGGTAEAKKAAREKFVTPLLARMGEGTAGAIGHVAEIADAEAPFAPKGCPAQAWSVGELIRLEREVLAI